MLFVVPRECWIGGRQIGDIGIEGQLHGHARDEGTTQETFRREPNQAIVMLNVSRD
jgi:hypothetical protein